MTKVEELRHEKAKRMRYKRPIACNMNLWQIREELSEMQEVCFDVRWFEDDWDNLVSAMDGNEDEAYEFKMAFSDLYAELERFREDLNDVYVPECFDELFPAAGLQCFGGYAGYDSFEGDYFGLDPYEYGPAEKEAEKRICRMTKNELLETVGACLKIVVSYLGIRYRYDCLEASMNILREKNMQVLKLFKAIEEQYDIAEKESNHFQFKYNKEVYELDEMLKEVPQEYWIQ